MREGKDVCLCARMRVCARVCLCARMRLCACVCMRKSACGRVLARESWLTRARTQEGGGMAMVVTQKMLFQYVASILSRAQFAVEVCEV